MANAKRPAATPKARGANILLSPGSLMPLSPPITNAGESGCAEASRDMTTERQVPRRKLNAGFASGEANHSAITNGKLPRQPFASNGDADGSHRRSDPQTSGAPSAEIADVGQQTPDSHVSGAASATLISGESGGDAKAIGGTEPIVGSPRIAAIAQEGQRRPATHSRCAILSKPIAGDSEGDGHSLGETHNGLAVAIPFGGNADAQVGQMMAGTQFNCADLSNIIGEIREQWRRRQAWHTEEKALTFRAKALCRRLAVDGDKKEADVIYDSALGDGDHPMGPSALGAIFPLIEARGMIAKHRTAVEKRLDKLAAQLPVAQWIEDCRGVGLGSLAAIIGEGGDLAVYANPGKLWKRFGLAPKDGKAYATWRATGGLTAADWTLAGYSPARRSIIWNISSCIVRANGPLRSVYDVRKAYEADRVETKAHAANRALRYLGKRFLLLLWQEWRRQCQCSDEIQRVESVAATVQGSRGIGRPRGTDVVVA